MHPAKTGKESNNKKAVIKTDQTNNGSLWKDKPFTLILKTVQIKFIAPKIDEAPETCNEKIAKSIAASECAVILDNGGYMVQPVPTPVSHKTEPINNKNDGGNNQKLILFILGNAISGLPIIKGKSKLPKLPIKVGITIKNIMTKAWDVTITLYKW